ncbi:MAG TPA: endolytic transglycosylase MltG [Thermoanaerobaculia bacterium]
MATKGRTGKKKTRRGCSGCLVLLVLLLIPAALAGWAWWQLRRPFQGYTGAEKLVTINPGTGAAVALTHLEREGVIANARLARLDLRFVLGNPPIQAGEYRFRGPLTTDQVLGKLIRGDVINQIVTVVEGMDLEEIADKLAAAKIGRRDAFLDLMRTPDLIADLDPEAQDLEGYLFPETYSFAPKTDEKIVVATMVKTFRARYEHQLKPLLDRRPGRTLRQIVTLASIVEKEAKASTERPVIAGVYSNRLNRKIGLAADPTVIFALKKLGRWDGNIHKADLQVDSPYNTYRYAGLPPGPICSPGIASLIAAADPADVPYLYFVSRNDGTHVFSSTLEEHNRNVEIWQKRYWREKRAHGG